MWIRWLLTPYCSREKFLIILYRSEICTILACFCLFGCHSNSLFFPEKFRWHIWILQPRNSYHIRRNWPCITYRTEVCAFLAFLCKFGCYGNFFCSPEIFISIFEFPDIENPTIHANIVSIAFTELNEFCGILVYSYIILVATATPLARWKI